MGLSVYLHYHEYDTNKEHPTLVLQGERTSSGYSVDPETGEITKQVCLCAARGPSECCCSYDWSEWETY